MGQNVIHQASMDAHSMREWYNCEALDISILTDRKRLKYILFCRLADKGHHKMSIQWTRQAGLLLLSHLTCHHLLQMPSKPFSPPATASQVKAYSHYFLHINYNSAAACMETIGI